ncbi:MAG: glycoside-pentoside-hexuronide (GPH):cation symporter [Clostridia bacterium]
MEKVVGLKEKLAYSAGSLGNNFIYSLMATYLIVFYTDFLRIPAFAITVLFLVARIWDAVNDPIMGIIVDNTQTRFGKFRPYLLFVPYVMAAFTILCFVDPGGSLLLKIIWAYATYILWGMSFTAMDIPYWSMTSALTQNFEERSSIVMFSRTFASIGYFITVVVAYPILVNALGGGSGGWIKTAVLLSVMAILLTNLAFLKTRERAKVEKREKQTLGKVILLLKANKPLLILMLSLLAVEISNAIKIIYPAYYIRYNFDSEALIPVFMAIYAVFTVFGSIIMPAVAKRLGKKKTALVGIVVMSLSSLAHFIAGYGSFTAIIVINAFGAAAFGLANIAMMSMLADTVEYGQWKTGIRAEGMVFSTNIFKTKIASALGGALGALALGIMAYDVDKAITVTMMNGFHAMISLVPAVICILAVIPIRKYILTEELYERILKEIGQDS